MSATPDIPRSLAVRVHLLVWEPGEDSARGRMRRTTQLGAVVRAAVLSDLYLAGALQDRAGKVEAVRGVRLEDPVLAGVHQQILDSAKARSWKYWVTRKPSLTLAEVRAGLAETGLADVTSSKLLGLIPLTKVDVRAPRVVAELRAGVTRALGGTPVSRLDPLDAATAALVATARFRWVVPARTARQQKERLAALAVVAGPAVPALRKALTEADAAGGAA